MNVSVRLTKLLTNNHMIRRTRTYNELRFAFKLIFAPCVRQVTYLIGIAELWSS